VLPARVRPKDLKAGISWHTKAAADQKFGLYHLSGCHDAGRGVAKDTARSFELYMQVVSTVEVDPLVCSAQYNVGIAYLKGDGVTRDVDRAVCWLERATQYGNQNARKVLPSLVPL